MYILQKDFDYFERIFKSLSSAKGKSFLDALARVVRTKLPTRVLKISVVNTKCPDNEDIVSGDCLTRRMIDEAYKTAR